MSAPLPQPPGALIEALADRYAFEGPIGSGGMATVYRARDLRHDRQVAIKVLRPEIAALIGGQRFLHEIRVTARLSHPNILPLFDSAEAGGVVCYVAPYVAGRSLGDRIRAGGALPIADAARIARQVAAALDYAHRDGVVHRDIKPANILLQDGAPLVADFGVALALAHAGDTRLTSPGMAVGTPSYMSPEQMLGHALDGRTDLFSLGCVLYEMLTAAQPWSGGSTTSPVSARLSGDPPRAARLRPDVPAALDDIVARAMQPSPDARFATGAEMAAAIEAAVETTPATGARTIDAARAAAPPAPAQVIRYCVAPDGVRLAYATVGEGPPIVKAANWLSHLEYDWQSPIWRHCWTALARRHRLVRYDQRGCGLSDWDISDLTHEARVHDLETVVEASGLDRFALLGISQGGPIAVSYAVRHPERVTHLVLHGSYARGRLLRGPRREAEEEARMITDIVRIGWGKRSPAFRQVFSTLFFPEAGPEQLESFNELQKVSSSPEMAARIIDSLGAIDVRDEAPKITAPTLVTHSDREERIPPDEGRLLASLIPGARFVPLPSRNHLPLGDEPAWAMMLEEIENFLAG